MLAINLSLSLSLMISNRITLRKHNYGTMNQWLHSWKPVDENEIAIILEDDLVVSFIVDHNFMHIPYT